MAISDGSGGAPIHFDAFPGIDNGASAGAVCSSAGRPCSSAPGS